MVYLAARKVAFDLLGVLRVKGSWEKRLMICVKCMRLVLHLCPGATVPVLWLGLSMGFRRGYGTPFLTPMNSTSCTQHALLRHMLCAGVFQHAA